MPGVTVDPRHPGPAPPVQIGALARATGLTVRTLHHYDAIGLLVPAERSSSGRRLYGDADVQRLYRIVALRRLGLSLPQIAAALDSPPELGDAIRAHLDEVRESIERHRRLAGTLERILDQLARREAPTVADLITAIEGITMTERHFTADQLEALARRRAELGEAGMRAAEAEWAQLIADVRAEQAAGSDPAGPRMQELAGRWRGLIAAFTGGDEGTRRSLQAAYEQEGSAGASQGMVDAELMAFVGRALQASG